MSRSSPPSQPVHLEYFGTLEKIADAKAEIFLGIEPGGAAVLNRDNAQFARLAAAAKAAGVARIVSFGEARRRRRAAHALRCSAECSTVEARILGHDVTYKLGAPGLHLVRQFARRAGGRRACRRRSRARRAALTKLKPAPGRGTRIRLAVPGGSALLIDESYNANPASMAAAIALLGQAELGPRGRRIAVLGDMLELGAEGPRCTATLPRLGRGQDRSCVLLGPADAFAVGGPSLRPPGRLCRDRGGAGAVRARTPSAPATR